MNHPTRPLAVAMIGPDLDARGGIATVARTLLGARALEGVEVTYLGSMREAPRARKAAIVASRQARFVARLARGWRPDLFHVHVSYFSSFYRKLAWFEEARATGRPVVVHVHAPDLEAFHNASRVHAAAMAWVFRRATRVIALSRHMEATLRGWMGDQARIDVLYNPVDLAGFAVPPRRPEAEPVVLFMGELGDRKGTWDLLAAVPEVLAAVPGARFHFGGNGDVDRLLRDAAAMGVGDHVRPLGWTKGADVVSAYARASVYCLPSYKEGLPMSILEAMAAGLPVVATPIAGVPEAVVDGATGFLVPAGDRAAIARQLTRLLADADLRGRMGAAGRERAAALFDVEAVASRLRSTWEEVVRGGSIP